MSSYLILFLNNERTFLELFFKFSQGGGGGGALGFLVCGVFLCFMSLFRSVSWVRCCI